MNRCRMNSRKTNRNQEQDKTGGGQAELGRTATMERAGAWAGQAGL